MELVVVRRDGSQHTILFDEEDAETVLARRWHVQRVRNDQFYAVTNIPGTQGRVKLRMHALLAGSHVDHVNRNGLDNRRANLRMATRSQQGANRQSKTGTSQYKGVSWVRSRARWQATIKVDNHARHLGWFALEVDAAQAYDMAAMQAWGDFALLNFKE